MIQIWRIEVASGSVPKYMNISSFHLLDRWMMCQFGKLPFSRNVFSWPSTHLWCYIPGLLLLGKPPSFNPRWSRVVPAYELDACFWWLVVSLVVHGGSSLYLVLVWNDIRRVHWRYGTIRVVVVAWNEIGDWFQRLHVMRCPICRIW